MPCLVCGVQDRELFCSETWAGAVQSACPHSACLGCVQQWIYTFDAASGPEGEPRAPCFVEGCPKRMPAGLAHFARSAAPAGLQPEAVVARAPDHMRRRAAHDAARRCPEEAGAEAWRAALELPRLRNAAARLGIGLISRARPRYVGEPELACGCCGQGRLALLENRPCGHRACASCWSRCAEDQIRHGLGGDGCFTCVEAGCQAPLDWGLLSGICAEHSEAVLDYAAALDPAVRKRDDKTRCLGCRKHAYTFRSNGACGCTACHDCWVRWAEAQLPLLPQKCAVIPCITAGCREGIQGGLHSLLCSASEAVRDFDLRLSAEVHALRDAEKRCGAKVDWAPCLASSPPRMESGPRCQRCGEHAWGLLVNPACGHRACSECWVAVGRARLGEKRLGEKRAHALCVGCERCADDGLWRAVTALSPELAQECSEARGKIARFHRLARSGISLEWQQATAEPGPTCVICGERQFALLRNARCAHGACDECWARWAEAQIDRCRSRMNDVGRCFGERCQELVALPLQKHLESASEPLKMFASTPMVSHRRRLRDNALYPPAVQVDCPDPNCWGLGYLGFDTVMCFICERIWTPEDVGLPAPVDCDFEEVMGVRVKKCPKCHEYIEKNGGCDHMTCKCGYEFWWSTLQPYRQPNR